MTVGFIGAGRMAQAMARGFISTGKEIISMFKNVFKTHRLRRLWTRPIFRP